MHLEEYLASELRFFIHPEYSFPCAKLGSKRLKDITIHFTHYNSEREAQNAWERRKRRIHWDNIFVLIEERDGLTKDQIINIANNKKLRGIVAFTNKDYKDIPYSVFLKKFANQPEVGG